MSESKFWEEGQPRVLGDFLGRPKAVKLLGTIEGKILDQGCGSGYIARMLARNAANKKVSIFGFDKDPDVVAKANMEESETGLKIKYAVFDARKTRYQTEFFDKIISASVLMMNSKEEIYDIIIETSRILKSEGTYVVAIPHPFLYMPGSPARKKGKNWVKYTPLENKPIHESQRFEEKYMDKNGETFFLKEVWNHSLDTYVNLFQKCFKIKKIQEPMVEKEHLLHSSWGMETGYPGYIQFRLEKP